MSLQITNTLTGKKEPFVPMKDKHVNMYVCGPTVYGFTHIGNARPLVFFSVVRNFLKQQGFEVTFVSNYTDVDDKIIARAKEEKISSEAVAEKYTKEYETDRKLLGLEVPDKTPKVTETIPEIIRFIEGLVEKGAAYVAPNGEVFYSVRGFPSYGKLSGKKIDELISGARVQPGEQKKDPLDFSLWKPQKEADEPAWDSPWGKGRPGWHIECSAMALAAFGETFDIHGGGIDLVHPHHENEIAQSEGLSGKPFARVWMHNNSLTFGAAKMSKSLGNIVLTRNFIEDHSAETLKFMLLGNHYRSPIDFSEQQIVESEGALHRIYSAIERCEMAMKEEVQPAEWNPSSEENALKKLFDAFPQLWQNAMLDDFNTAQAMGYVFEYVRAVNSFVDRKQFVLTASGHKLINGFVHQLREFGEVLCLFQEEAHAFLGALRERHLKKQGITADWVNQKVQERVDARLAKDFKKSDQLRDELLSKKIALKDKGNVTAWDVTF